VRDVGFHALRHTAVSRFLAQERLNRTQLSAIIGHASTQIMFDLYGHLMPDAFDGFSLSLDPLTEGALDHRGDAQAAGLELRKRRSSSSATRCRDTGDGGRPLVARDLPLKVPVWDDGGHRKQSYTTPAELCEALRAERRARGAALGDRRCHGCGHRALSPRWAMTRAWPRLLG
jgi:hypothetical protein